MPHLPVIRVERLGKEFTIGARERGHNTLRDLIASFARRREKARSAPERFWALRDVSFSVGAGEVLGVIGRNGAGKSTLLKILSRITEPTTGAVDIRGRVGSLLEVGTGFHSELTGRENIFLNGAILGMPRVEISRKFDEIVGFAEVERFIDTPVKHYSSGMFLRLGFAVAAHLEPEVLIVDEVLAVGDAEFQRKCLAKMGSVAREGRTVLFVSHNLDAVRRLCTRCVLLERGELTDEGSPDDITARYAALVHDAPEPGTWHPIGDIARVGSGEVRLTSIRYENPEAPDGTPRTDAPVTFALELRSEAAVTVRCLSFTLFDLHGQRLVNAELATLDSELALQPGRNVVRVTIRQLHLNAGTYAIGYWISRRIEDRTPLDSFEGGPNVIVHQASTDQEAYPWAFGPVSSDFTMEMAAADQVPRD